MLPFRHALRAQELVELKFRGRVERRANRPDDGEQEVRDRHLCLFLDKFLRDLLLRCQERRVRLHWFWFLVFYGGVHVDVIVVVLAQTSGTSSTIYHDIVEILGI